MKITKESFLTELQSMAEPDYRDFSSKLIPGGPKMLGIRIPKLRVIAKKLAGGDYMGYFKNCCNNLTYYEEIAVYGYVIGYLKTDIDYILERVREYVPLIDNWSINDGFCATLKITKKNMEKVWDFIQPYCRSKKEYELRFGVIMIMDYFLTEDYIDRSLEIIMNLRHEGYYARMGIAWTVATAYAKNKDKTLAFLDKWTPCDWTYNKAIQKMKESSRISKEDKLMLTSLKKIQKN